MTPLHAFLHDLIQNPPRDEYDILRRGIHFKSKQLSPEGHPPIPNHLFTLGYILWKRLPSKLSWFDRLLGRVPSSPHTLEISREILQILF